MGLDQSFQGLSDVGLHENLWNASGEEWAVDAAQQGNCKVTNNSSVDVGYGSKAQHVSGNVLTEGAISSTLTRVHVITGTSEDGWVEDGIRTPSVVDRTPANLELSFEVVCWASIASHKLNRGRRHISESLECHNYHGADFSVSIFACNKFVCITLRYAQWCVVYKTYACNILLLLAICLSHRILRLFSCWHSISNQESECRRRQQMTGFDGIHRFEQRRDFTVVQQCELINETISCNTKVVRAAWLSQGRWQGVDICAMPTG